MALSLDSLYRPFNEFFSQQFPPSGGAPVIFRFAEFARTFTDSDFLNPLHPEQGPRPEIAHELLCTTVDCVPYLDPEGHTVSFLTGARLSDLYHDEIVDPAIPFVPTNVTDDAEKQARIDAFITAKADAIKLWKDSDFASLLEGSSVKIRAANAEPGKWWDKTDANVWKNKSFQVKGATTVPGQPAPPTNKLLRMKVSDNVLQSVIQAQVVSQAAPQLSPAVGRPTVMLSRPAMLMAQPVFTAALANNTTRLESIRTTPAVRREVMFDPSLTTIDMHNEVAPKIAVFPFRQRQELIELLATEAPRQPVVTNDVTISFDYCAVNITRSWLHRALIYNPSWCIPGQGKGKLSANDRHGLPVLPVGFVAFKNLSIQAPWTPEDITNLEQAEQFGPFNFDSKVVNGAITHTGIQIVGWILQTVPDLPPNAT